MEFVVHVKGDPPEQGYWVLAVDAARNQFLISREEGKFVWVTIGDCTFVRLVNPEMPKPVVAVQPKQAITVPTLHLGNGRS